MNKSTEQLFAVCVSNEEYPAALERRKIYVVLEDIEADALGLLRVIDESGEDYLYPASIFQLIELPQSLSKAILSAA